MPASIKYSFNQKFNIPARKAYEWCTEYTPEDQTLMREKNAKREVQRIAEDIVVLVDAFFTGDKMITKKKLVCLYPSQLSWTSTHLTGPNKYSQFFYQITTEHRTHSRLKFTALHLDHSLKEDTNDQKVKQIARELRKIDSATWKILAKEMERELTDEQSLCNR